MGVDDRKNVFVVGAGASAEFGLPTGKALLRDIAKLATARYDARSHTDQQDIDQDVKDAIDAFAQTSFSSSDLTIEKIYKLRGDALWISRNATLAPSIDNLLHTHQQDQAIVKIGKVLITKALVEAEKKSSLFVARDDPNRFGFFSKLILNPRDSNNRINATESWLGELFWLLVELRDFDQFLSALKNITFISFNYDRCIEQFITTAAWSYFRLGSDAAQTVLDSVNIIRPYGSLGDLKIDHDGLIGFGQFNPSLFNSSHGIRTFTEGVKEEGIVAGIESALNTADLVFFMGFGFIELNIKLLFGDSNFKAKRVVGTRKGLSDESAELVCGILGEKLVGEGIRTFTGARDPMKLELSDLTCRELLNKHQFFLRGQRPSS